MLYESGPWRIDVDAAKTRAFYSAHTGGPCSCQNCRNYRFFCDNCLTQTEKDFFDRLGIVSHVECAVSCFGMEEDRRMPAFGFYPAAGICLEAPPEERRALEKIPVGRFAFSFSPLEDYAVPEGLAGPAVQVNFTVRMPWLLPEEYRENAVLPSGERQLCERMKRRGRAEKAHERELALKRWTDYLKTMGAPFEVLSGYEAARNEWFERFAPAPEKGAAARNCLPFGDFRNYLWHLFSFGHLPGAEQSRIPELYAGQPRQEYTVLLENEELGFRVHAAPPPDLSFVNQFADVLVTGAAFTWTYAHTHEDGLYGPYYCEKKDNGG